MTDANEEKLDSRASSGTSAKKPHRSDSWLIVEQKRLSGRGLFLMMVTMSVLTPCSMDMYIPALPSMVTEFATDSATANFTILGFFICFTISTLFFGPLSDKLGRKPILITGFILFTTGCVMCALSWNIWSLIAFRLMQAVGAGCVVSVNNALAKDCFEPEQRQKLLSILQVMMILGPILAPLIGGFILMFAPWHAVFWALAALGGLCLILSSMFQESLPPEQRSTMGVFKTLGRLPVVARQPKFMLLVLVMSCTNLAFNAYISVGSYIYITFFGQTEQVYSYFFAASAALGMVGPILYLKFQHHTTPRKFTWFLLITALTAGVLLVVVGSTSMWVFWALYCVFNMVASTIRPYNVNILLNTVDSSYAGSASSLITFTSAAIGCIGGAAIMLPFPNYIVGLGSLMIAGMIVALVLFAYLLRSPHTPEELKK